MVVLQFHTASCYTRCSYISPCFLPLRLVDGQIAPSKHSDLVLEDEVGICGFALALTDAKVAMTPSQVRDQEDTTTSHLLLLALNCVTLQYNCTIFNHLNPTRDFRYQVLLTLVH